MAHKNEDTTVEVDRTTRDLQLGLQPVQLGINPENIKDSINTSCSLYPLLVLGTAHRNRGAMVPTN